ncbi:universal stress protein [Streptomyces kaniharaensis]|uniref:Universal stress protein n=1 Tax=Streptomyces kaniharaensis TaxID=212423 RepID=A0A6N7L0P7_9ACTN|nr:universal stress protein [Streptomyces kaniharaensis]MQS16247.1 universal stress protein [Streptomyces kaniharaensis]
MAEYVLAAIDGSEESIAAARWAADEATRHGLPLRLVHAQTWLDDLHNDRSQPADVRALTTRMLSDAKRAVDDTHRRLEIRAELIGGGEPVDVLVDAAADARMLVLGSRGLGGFGGLMVGSIGLAVTARSEVPTVLVRSGGTERPDGAEVVVGVDTREAAPDVIDFAFREAERRGAVLRAVHGWTPPPVWGYAGWVAPQPEAEQFREIEDELFTLAMTGWQEKYPEVTVVQDSRIGSGAAALVDACADADLVVVGRRRRPQHHGGMRLGPVAHAVLHHAQPPVAVVPHD